jgi:hypothetical protein
LVKVWHHTRKNFRDSVYDAKTNTFVKPIFRLVTVERNHWFSNVYDPDKPIPVYFWDDPDPVDLWRHDPDAWLLQVHATSIQDWYDSEYSKLGKRARKNRGLTEPPKQWYTVRTDHLWLYFHEPDAQGVPTAIVAMHGAMNEKQALVAYRRAQKAHPNLLFRMYQPHTDTGVMLPDAQKAAARQQP